MEAAWLVRRARRQIAEAQNFILKCYVLQKRFTISRSIILILMNYNISQAHFSPQSQGHRSRYNSLQMKVFREFD